jgi:hypothetical protein
VLYDVIDLPRQTTDKVLAVRLAVLCIEARTPGEGHENDVELDVRRLDGEAMTWVDSPIEDLSTNVKGWRRRLEGDEVVSSDRVVVHEEQEGLEPLVDKREQNLRFVEQDVVQ